MKKRKITALILALCLMTALLGGCAGKSFDMAATETVTSSAAPMAQAAGSVNYTADMKYEAAPEEVMMDDADGGWGETTTATSTTGASNNNFGGHKVIRNAYLDMESREFDTVMTYIQDTTAQLGGYVSACDIRGRKPEVYGEGGRYADISLRIPSQKLDSFLESVRGVATVTYESIGSEDITNQYFDSESRLEVCKTQYDRVLELLKKAENMEDIILLEQRLSELTYEMERLSGNLKHWDDLVDYSSVQIGLREVSVIHYSASDDGFGTRVSDGLRNTFSGIGVFYEDLAQGC